MADDLSAFHLNLFLQSWILKLWVSRNWFRGLLLGHGSDQFPFKSLSREGEQVPVVLHPLSPRDHLGSIRNLGSQGLAMRARASIVGQAWDAVEKGEEGRKTKEADHEKCRFCIRPLSISKTMKIIGFT